MINLELDRKSPISLYVQLFEQISDKILNGIIKEGTKLPSQRELAKEFNISINTVVNAYNMLIQYEYVTSLNRSGYYVNKKTCNEKTFSEKRWQNDFPCKYNFSKNGVDLKMTEPLKRTLRQTAKMLTDQGFSYPDYIGEYELRKQICLMLNKSCEISCLPTQIIIGAGVNYLLDLLIKVIGTDKIYGFENPTFYKIQDFIKLSKYKTSYLNVTTKGVTLTELNHFDADVLFLMPYHNYPISSTLSIEQKKDIIEWAKNGSYIIEYSYDMEFLYSNTNESLFSMTNDENVIFIGDFSKTISPNFGISYLVLPETLVKRWKELYRNFHSYGSRFEQIFISEVIKNNAYYRNINRLKKNYDTKRKCLISAIKNHKIGNRIEIKNSDAGTFLIIEPQTACSADELIVEAHKSGVKLSYLKNALEQPNSLISSKSFVLGFGGLSEEDIHNGINLLLDTWEKIIDKK